MKVVATTANHQYEFYVFQGQLFCTIDNKEKRGPCKVIGKREITVGQPIDVICQSEEDDFHTRPVEKLVVYLTNEDSEDNKQRKVWRFLTNIFK